MDIVNIDDHRKIWRTDAAGCAACGHKWQAVYPMGAGDVGLECPSCGSGLGSVLPYEDNRGLSSNGDIVERLRIRIHTSADETALTNEAADEIERLQEQVEFERASLQAAFVELRKLDGDIERMREVLQNIADGPRDVEKSYISLLHEVRSEARAAITKYVLGQWGYI